MRLSTRVSLFFVAALAVVLLGFSTALYALAFRYLHRQVDDGLEAAINMLVAAAEVTPEGVEWEPRERSLSFGRRALEGQLIWQVRDDQGRRIDGASLPQGQIGNLFERPSTENPRYPVGTIDDRGVPWRVLWRRLRAADLAEGPSSADTDDQGQPATRHAALTLAAAVSMEDMRATLRTLGLVLTCLSFAVWTLALLLGRRLCRRALRPLTLMAEAALAIRGDQPHERLPEPRSNDELQELAQAINGLLDRLQESFERQRQFTGDASHQLRTPLTSIQGQVDLALRQQRDPDEYRRVLDVVQRKTRHLRQIVESLLFLARADGETLEPLLEPVELADWLASYIRSWSEARPETALGVVLEAEGPVRVKVQPSLLAELVRNLLDNAIRHADAFAPVRVRLHCDDGWALVEVEDQGVGIAVDDLPHIFEPFYRSAAARRRATPGVGLGLAVAQRLARSFGGSIDAASRPGHGSLFTVHLPLDEQPHAAHPGQSAADLVWT
jgi:signal transduction histidine kinase